MKKYFVKAIALAVMACVSMTMNADVITHQGDRYIINVEEMELTGEESLMDVLLMCPEAISLNFRTTATSVNPFDNWSVRTDNLNIDVDPEIFLAETKASEVSKIKLCTHAGIMKGSSGLNKKIDVYFKKNGPGTNGRLSAKADTYGNISSYNTAKYETNNMVLWGSAMGWLRRNNIDGAKIDGNGNATKVGINWDITPKDNLVMQLSQRYGKVHFDGGNVREFGNYYNFSMVYVRTMSDNGASFLFQGVVDYATNRESEDASPINYHNRETDPYIVGEFNFPFLSKNLWITAGVETGVTSYADVTYDQYEWAHYADLYAQIDWNIKGVNISLGDRARALNYWQNNLVLDNKQTNTAYNHSHFNHSYTASVYGKIAPKSTLQGTFARRYWNASFVNREDITPDFLLMNEKVNDKFAYTSELKYTYQQKDLTFMGMVNNVHHTNVGENENTLQLGASLFWHTGMLRLFTGATYFHDRINWGDMIEYNNYVRFRVQPQVELQNAWRIIPTVIYNSRIDYKQFGYVPANLYASLAVAKPVGNWDFDLAFNNIASQHYGKRNVSLTATYYWGRK